MSIIPFIGALRRCQTKQNFSNVRERLFAEIGEVPALSQRLAGEVITLDASILGSDHRLERDKDTLRLFSVFSLDEVLYQEHNAQRIMRVDVGDHALLRQLLQADRFAGLFGVVSLLLCENDDKQTCSISYVVPSTLLTIDANGSLGDHARALDEKINSLVLRLAA